MPQAIRDIYFFCVGLKKDLNKATFIYNNKQGYMSRVNLEAAIKSRSVVEGLDILKYSYIKEIH